jgi:hypothetical protein
VVCEEGRRYYWVPALGHSMICVGYISSLLVDVVCIAVTP